MKRSWFIGSIAGLALASGGPGRCEELPEEILVTAQKKEQDLVDVPSSVAALRDEKLDVMTSGGGDVGALLSSRVPSLHVESSFGRTFPRFYIRGLGNTDFDLNASQPVSLVYDGVVLENPILKGFPIFDVDRVEVLRGPQGTLFGRNTPAGIVKFESRPPGWEVDGFGRLSYGRYNMRQFEGGLGGPLVEDELAGRASVLYQGRGDWVNNTFTHVDDATGGHDEIAGRAQLLWKPKDEFRALLNLHGRELNGTARIFQANMVTAGSNDIVGSYERDEIAHDGRNEQELQTGGGVLTMDYDVGRVTLTSVTGYEAGNLFSRGDIDGGFGAAFAPPYGPGEIPFSSETADGVPALDQFTEELRVASNEWDQVNFQAGGYYFWEDLRIESYSFDTLAGGDQNGFAKQQQEATSYALFGTVEVDATDRLLVTGGARFSHDEKDFVAERLESPLSFLGIGPLAPIRVKPEDDVVGWDASALFSLSDDANVYGRVARSFRAPSIQGRVLFGDEVTVANTEKILSYEGGVKGTLWDRRARGALSVFYYQMDDQQLTAVGGTTNSNRLLNADKSNGTGFEAELDALLSDSMVLTAGASYNRTRIDDPLLQTALPFRANTPVTVRDPIETIPGPSAPFDTLLATIHDNRLPNAPEWVLNATLRDSYPVGRDGELFWYTDWAVRSEVSFFLYDSVEFTEGTLVEGGLRAGWARQDGTLELAAFGRNITNDLSRVGGIDFNNFTGFVNEPASWGVEIRSRL
jgi:iron complex outermembrane receptor protein